jgi:WG repeat protein
VMFDLVDTFHGGVAIVSQDARFGVVDPEGRFVVKPRFEAIRPADSVFYDNRALFTLFDKKGYVSRAGTIAVPPRWDAALPFSEGLAAVTRGDDTGYIDTTGRMVIAPRWWSGSRFSRGRAVVIMGSLCGYIDRNGAFVAKPQFTDAKAFNAEDRALAWKGPIKGWLDLSGRWTPTRIDELQRLDDSLSVVVVDGRTWLMRRATEQTIREYPWADLGPFREGLARARGPDGRFGFIDLEDRVVIPLRFQQAAGFDHGLCKAATRDTLGYIDRTGAWVWSSRFR